MKRLITFIATAVIAAQIFAANPPKDGYQRQAVPNCGIMGRNADAYFTSANLISRSDERFTVNGNVYVESIIRKTGKVIKVRQLTLDGINELFGEGTMRLARDYIRFDLYNQSHSVRQVFRKICHNVEGKEDLWLVIALDNSKK